MHENLLEHLNAEITLNTITNISSAIRWLKSTFFYVRLCKNPQNYKINGSIQSKQTNKKIEEYLSDLCIKNLKTLVDVKLIENCDLMKAEIKPTINNRKIIKLETLKKMIFVSKFSIRNKVNTPTKQAKLSEVNSNFITNN